MAIIYKKISELNEETEIAAEDVMPISDISENETKKIKAKYALTSSLQIYLVEDITDCEVKDGFWYIRIPYKLHGRKLVEVHAACITAGEGGTMTIQIRNAKTFNELLSTLATIDSNKTDTLTSTTKSVINPLYQTVNHGDILSIDIKTVHHIPAKGLIVDLAFL